MTNTKRRIVLGVTLVMANGISYSTDQWTPNKNNQNLQKTLLQTDWKEADIKKTNDEFIKENEQIKKELNAKLNKIREYWNNTTYTDKEFHTSYTDRQELKRLLGRYGINDNDFDNKYTQYNKHIEYMIKAFKNEVPTHTYGENLWGNSTSQTETPTNKGQQPTSNGIDPAILSKIAQVASAKATSEVLALSPTGGHEGQLNKVKDEIRAGTSIVTYESTSKYVIKGEVQPKYTTTDLNSIANTTGMSKRDAIMIYDITQLQNTNSYK